MLSFKGYLVGIRGPLKEVIFPIDKISLKEVTEKLRWGLRMEWESNSSCSGALRSGKMPNELYFERDKLDFITW